MELMKVKIEAQVTLAGKTYSANGVMNPAGIALAVMTTSCEEKEAVGKAMNERFSGKVSLGPLFKGDKLTFSEGDFSITISGVEDKPADFDKPPVEMLEQLASMIMEHAQGLKAKGGATDEELQNFSEMLDRPINTDDMGSVEDLLKQFRPQGKAH